MKRIVFRIMLVLMMVPVASHAKGASDHVITQIVKFLTRSDSSDEVVNQHYRVVQKFDDFGNSLGKAGSGLAIGTTGLVTLIEKRALHIMLGLSSDYTTGKPTTLYVYAALRDLPGRGISQAIDRAIYQTHQRAQLLVEKAAMQTAGENPAFGKFLIGTSDDAWVQFLNNGRPYTNTNGKVYGIDLKNMDPAVLKSFLERVVQNVEEVHL